MVSVERDLRIADVVGDHEVLLGIAQLLSEILCEQKHTNNSERTGSISSASIESNSKGFNLSVKAYAGSVVPVDEVLEEYGRLYRETNARAMADWQATVDGLQQP